MSDLAERLEDIQNRNNGYSDEEAKRCFLEFLCEGETITQAARHAGRTATWFKRRRNPEGANYDPEFTQEYEKVTAPGGEYKYALVESLVDDMVAASRSGNVRASEKLLMAYSEDFAFMRPQVAQGDWNIDKLQVYLPNVSTETLLTMREELLKARQAELPVIDAQ
jgi:hypothetical protein